VVGLVMVVVELLDPEELGGHADPPAGWPADRSTARGYSSIYTRTARTSPGRGRECVREAAGCCVVVLIDGVMRAQLAARGGEERPFLNGLHPTRPALT
jgi:hypothetical protein